MRKYAFTLAFIIGMLMFALPTEAQTLRNGSGSAVGKVESDGTVRNSSGSYMGKAEGLSREQAAAVFFFPFF